MVLYVDTLLRRRNTYCAKSHDSAVNRQSTDTGNIISLGVGLIHEMTRHDTHGCRREAIPCAVNISPCNAAISVVMFQRNAGLFVLPIGNVYSYEGPCDSNRLHFVNVTHRLLLVQ